MVIGIDFEWHESNPNILKKLFADFDFSKYTWDVYNEQAWDKDSNDLFESKAYSGIEFSSIIKKPTKLVMLISIKAFDGAVKEIESFDDYLSSDCQFMFYVIDCVYVDLYCKHEEDLNFFYQRAKKLNVSGLDYITDENLCRTGF